MSQQLTCNVCETTSPVSGCETAVVRSNVRKFRNETFEARQAAGPRRELGLARCALLLDHVRQSHGSENTRFGVHYMRCHDDCLDLLTEPVRFSWRLALSPATPFLMLFGYFFDRHTDIMFTFRTRAA